MKIVDSLLVAPLVFCLVGALVGALSDLGFSSLCAAISIASIVALGLHWLIGRAGRRRRSVSAGRDRG
jgi:hypothetical protein